MENEKKERIRADWHEKSYSFFQHSKCEAFPCHTGVEIGDFNCLFCYCPLYALDDKCGGNYKYSETGIKDCSGCIIPHLRDNYGYINERFGDISKMMQDTRLKNKQ